VRLRLRLRQRQRLGLGLGLGLRLGLDGVLLSQDAVQRRLLLPPPASPPLHAQVGQSQPSSCSSHRARRARGRGGGGDEGGRVARHSQVNSKESLFPLQRPTLLPELLLAPLLPPLELVLLPVLLEKRLLQVGEALSEVGGNLRNFRKLGQGGPRHCTGSRRGGRVGAGVLGRLLVVVERL